MKDYLGFRKWYNTNKDTIKDKTIEQIAWEAWSAATEQSNTKKEEKETGYYLDVN